MPNELVVLLVIGIVLLVPPSIINRIIGAIVTIISVALLFYAQGVATDALVDAGVDVAQDLNLLNIPNSLCPTSFNRTDYCVEFGLDKEELTGHAFLSHQISEYVDLRFETKDKLLTCKLTKDKMCNFAEIKSADDLKISLTDKMGTTILTQNQLRKEIKATTKIFGLTKLIKKIRW